MSIDIEGFEYKENIISTKYGLIAEIYKSKICSLYWIRFLKEINRKLVFVAIKIRNGTSTGIKAIKQVIENKLFAEVAEKSKILEVVEPFKNNHNKKTEGEIFDRHKFN